MVKLYKWNTIWILVISVWSKHDGANETADSGINADVGWWIRTEADCSNVHGCIEVYETLWNRTGTCFDRDIRVALLPEITNQPDTGLEQLVLFFERTANRQFECLQNGVDCGRTHHGNVCGCCRESLNWVIRRTISEWVRRELCLPIRVFLRQAMALYSL